MICATHSSSDWPGLEDTHYYGSQLSDITAVGEHGPNQCAEKALPYRIGYHKAFLEDDSRPNRPQRPTQMTLGTHITATNRWMVLVTKVDTAGWSPTHSRNMERPRETYAPSSEQHL